MCIDATDNGRDGRASPGTSAESFSNYWDIQELLVNQFRIIFEIIQIHSQFLK